MRERETKSNNGFCYVYFWSQQKLCIGEEEMDEGKGRKIKG